MRARNSSGGVFRQPGFQKSVSRDTYGTPRSAASSLPSVDCNGGCLSSGVRTEEGGHRWGLRTVWQRFRTVPFQHLGTAQVSVGRNQSKKPGGPTVGGTVFLRTVDAKKIWPPSWADAAHQSSLRRGLCTDRARRRGAAVSVVLWPRWRTSVRPSLWGDGLRERRTGESSCAAFSEFARTLSALNTTPAKLALGTILICSVPLEPPAPSHTELCHTRTTYSVPKPVNPSQRTNVNTT